MVPLRTLLVVLLAGDVVATGSQRTGTGLERSFLSQFQARPPVAADVAVKGASLLQPQLPPVASLLQPTGIALLQPRLKPLQLVQQRISLFSPGDADAAARTLRSLDTNGNGKIDPAEIAAFAQMQGLDSATAQSELTTLDADGDGALSAAELTGMLSNEPQVAVPSSKFLQQPAQLAPAVPLQPAQVQQLPQLTPASFASAATDVSSAGTLNLDEDLGVSTVEDVLSSNTGGLDAGVVRASAQTSANTFVEQLSLEQKEEAAAQELEHRAADLRANSTALSRRMIKSAMSAGAEAASKKAQEVLSTMLWLEAEETKKEIATAALQAKAKAELREAHELMSIADSALLQTGLGVPAT